MEIICLVELCWTLEQNRVLSVWPVQNALRWSKAKMEAGLVLTPAARSYINSSCSSKIVQGFNGLLRESSVLQATTAPKD